MQQPKRMETSLGKAAHQPWEKPKHFWTEETVPVQEGH